MERENYWKRRTTSRRNALRTLTASGAGLAALSFAGCGDDDKSTDSPSSPQAAVDSTKGIRGGTFVVQTQGWNISLISVQDITGVAQSFAHSGLLEMKAPRPIVDKYSLEVDPEVAVSMPEQPDQTTLVFKLKDARFHNGRTLTSADVAYSLDRYQNWQNSAGRSLFQWLDKVETPDSQTAIIKAKQPFAEWPVVLSSYQTWILAKEHEEGPNAANGYMGLGPYTFVDVQNPVQMRFKRNPDFWQPPYPYFDEVILLGGQDDAARIATFLSRQAHWTWSQVPPANVRAMDQGRPDAVKTALENACYSTRYRVDRPPFNDKRVRQAMSMTVDRNQIRQAFTESNPAEDDQTLSWVIAGWGFRKPKDLGNAAKYWNYDPQTAKQLLSAAGVSSPVKAQFHHADPTFLGQGFVDHAELSMAKWRENGIADLTDVQVPIGQILSTVAAGNYEGCYLFPHDLANQASFGINIRSFFFSPPTGVTPPTLNRGYINNPQLSTLVDKQLAQLDANERKATLRQAEDILAEEQYWTTYSSYQGYVHTDPRLRNYQVAKFWFGGMRSSTRYWWFDKA